MSYEENKTTGLQLFDFSASAVGSFPKTLRGYACSVVDTYIRELEKQVISAKREARDLEAKVFRLELLLDSGDFAKLGTHTAEILTAAEKQAAELVQKGQLDAESFIEEALKKAKNITDEAEIAAQEIKMTGINSVARMQEKAKSEIDSQLADNAAHCDAMLSAAAIEADKLRKETEIWCENLRQEAKITADRSRQEANAQAAHILASANAEKSEILAQVQDYQTQSQADMANILEESKKQTNSYRALLAEQTEKLNQERQAALNISHEIKAAALAEAEAIREEARQAAKRERSETDNYVYEEKRKLNREITQLIQQRDAISAQLANLSALASLSASELNQRNQEVSKRLDSQPQLDENSEETTVLHKGNNDQSIFE